MKLQTNVNNLCLIIDVKNWAFDNIAKKIQKKWYGKKGMNALIITYDDLDVKIKSNTFKLSKYKYYLFFYLPIGDILKNRIKKFDNRNVIIYSLYNNFTFKLRFFEKLFINVDKFLVSSPKIYNNILKYFNKTPDGYCIDGVDEKMFKYTGYDSLTKDKLVVGWIGNSDPKINGIIKGYKQIDETLCDLSNNFVFKPLDRHVRFIQHNKVPVYIKDIDIIVCFSTSEGTPNQILEASSSGKCWISTDVGISKLLSDSIPNNKCGLIIKREKSDLKSKLIYLNENRHLLEEYGRNGRKAILKNFTWDKRLVAMFIAMGI